MDLFLPPPVLLLTLSLIIAALLLWLTNNFYWIGGWNGIHNYLSVFIGVRIDLLRRQRLTARKYRCMGRTAQGFELQFGTNHMGHHFLTHLLLPSMAEGGVSSLLPPRPIPWANWTFEI
eukprot:scaffold69028_cov41-Attheya_sp.AAC.1